MVTKIMTFKCHIDSNFIESNLRSTRQVSPKSVLTMLLSCILFFFSFKVVFCFSFRCLIRANAQQIGRAFFSLYCLCCCYCNWFDRIFFDENKRFFLSVTFTRFSKTLSNVIFKPNCKSSNSRPSIRQCMPGRTKNR